MGKPDDDEDDPLITESIVEAFRRARREARLPATPEAEAVGALNELIGVLESARELWERAAQAAGASELGDRLQAEADGMETEVASLSTAVRDFGGAPPTNPAREALPFSARDLDYAGDDVAIEAGLATNRSHLVEARRRLAARPVSERARALLLGSGKS